METIHCDRCARETTHVRGLCTLCTRREEDGQKGIVWVSCGLLLLVWLLGSFVMPDFSFSINIFSEARAFMLNSALTGIGLLVVGQGLLMIIRSRPRG